MFFIDFRERRRKSGRERQRKWEREREKERSIDMREKH